MTERKTCIYCGETKDISAFVSKTNGCKECKKKYLKKYLLKPIDFNTIVTCVKCENSKSLSEFPKTGNICKLCKNENLREYRKINKEYTAKYNKEYKTKNKEVVNKKHKEWLNNNKDRVNKTSNSYIKNRLKSDLQFKLAYSASKLIRNSLIKEGKSIWKYLPYTPKQLKDHIESLFEPWMNFNNHGIYKKSTWDDNDKSTWVWNIDHIIPQSKFKYTSMEDEGFKKCWALSNLRPYSAKLNVLENDGR